MSDEYRRDYNRGWGAPRRAGALTLERADARGEPKAWYDGYLDFACGREKWATTEGESPCEDK